MAADDRNSARSQPNQARKSEGIEPDRFEISGRAFVARTKDIFDLRGLLALGNSAPLAQPLVERTARSSTARTFAASDTIGLTET